MYCHLFVVHSIDRTIKFLILNVACYVTVLLLLILISKLIVVYERA